MLTFVVFSFTRGRLWTATTACTWNISHSWSRIQQHISGLSTNLRVINGAYMVTVCSKNFHLLA